MIPRPRLLIVDDELLIRDLLYDFFKGREYDIAVADSGQSALAQLERGRFDTVILDLKMPDMDGLELAGRIRETDERVPIIFMTGYPSLESAIEAVRRHADDYFIKPFNVKQMNKAVEAALARTGSAPPPGPDDQES
ncbi:MAG: response regulator [candidate division Zixibacteria bacterium]|nr:response regulator [candidate division Zixibacteria bacterium]